MENQSTLPPRVKDFRGKPFGILTVIRFYGFRDLGGQHVSVWWCRCACGNEKPILQRSLVSKASKSCGCRGNSYSLNALSQQYPIENDAWVNMRQRCMNPRHPSFKHYGGRGITVYPLWTSFKQFLTDVGRCPGKGYTLERKNNNESYTPGNVIWQTTYKQHRNMRSNIILTYQGKTLCLTDWAKEISKPFETLKHRYRKRWSIEKILSPLRFPSGRPSKNSLSRNEYQINLIE